MWAMEHPNISHELTEEVSWACTVFSLPVSLTNRCKPFASALSVLVFCLDHLFLSPLMFSTCICIFWMCFATWSFIHLWNYSCHSQADEGDNLWGLLDKKVMETQRFHSATADATVEVQCFITAAYIKRTGDPLEYWTQHLTMYPHQYRQAKKYLSIPATSVTCERIFSKAGEI